MASAPSSQDFSHLQDVLGSLPMLKRYTVLCLCFCLDDTTSTIGITDVLKAALEQLAEGFSFLAGRIIYEGRDEYHTGIAKIVPHQGDITLSTNDLTDSGSFPSMATLRSAKYPSSMLDPASLLPPIAVSWSTDCFDKIAPVLMLQANFVKGGLLLTFSVNHATTDMTGLGMIISLFSKACRNESFTKEEIEQGNRTRRAAVPLLGNDYMPQGELDDAMMQPQQPQQNKSTAAPKTWAYFNFTTDCLKQLKEDAGNQEIVPYITTDDTVAAFCWQRITKAREQRLGKDISSQFARPLSVRKYLGLQDYLGYMVDVVYENEVDVWRRPFGEIAGRLRRIVQQDDEIRHHIQAFATILDRLDDKSKMGNGALLNTDRDVIFSSYANIKCCELSFGPLLGMPDTARRPRMPAAPSLLYMMPKSRDGDTAVAFCLLEEDLERIRQDEVFASRATYIG